MKTSWLKAAPLLALNVVFWLAYAVMVGVLWVIGVPLIWYAARNHNFYRGMSKVYEGRELVRWYIQWMNPVWGNDQEGVDGFYDAEFKQAWWRDRFPRPLSDKDWRRAIIEWSMRRNSTNNLRFMHHFVPWLGWINPKTIKPSRIRWAGPDAPLASVLVTVIPGENTVGTYYRQRFACLFVSQGLYAGLRIAVRFKGRAHQIWFGWKLNPGMAVEGWWPDDPCWKGVGFTCGQVRHSA